MTEIEKNLQNIRMEMPADVKLVAVSKFNSPERISDAYAAGQRLFGESRVQELLTKVEVLPRDIEWHFIGHLQTNKVRSLIGNVSMIESIDSEKLLSLVSQESEKKGVVTDILLQLHVAREETKFGFTPEELEQFVSTHPWERYKGIRIRGVMGMASNTEDRERIRRDFMVIRGVFDKISQCYRDSLPDFDTVSMGMSGDWKISIECGSTSIRLGSAIFGERMYSK